MREMKAIAAAALAAAILFGCASGPTPRDAFYEADTDADGFVTWKEHRDYLPDTKREAFLATDADRDERLDVNEFTAGFGVAF